MNKNLKARSLNPAWQRRLLKEQQEFRKIMSRKKKIDGPSKGRESEAQAEDKPEEKFIEIIKPGEESQGAQDLDDLNFDLPSNAHEKPGDIDDDDLASLDGGGNLMSTIERIKALAPKRAAFSGKPHPRARKVQTPVAAGVFGPADLPEPGDKQFEGLWGCQSKPDIEAWLQKSHHDFRRKFQAGYEKRDLPLVLREGLDALTTNRATDSPVMLNERVCELGAEHVGRQLSAIAAADPTLEFVHITIIAGDGQTSSDQTIIDLGQLHGRSMSVARAVSKNFIGITEFAHFNSHGHPKGGRMIHGHLHIVHWGEGVVAEAQKVAARRMSEFPPNLTGAPQIKVQRVEPTEINLMRIAAYLFKAPSKAMTFRPPSEGKDGYLHHSEKGDRNIVYLRMAQIRSMLLLDDVLIAGGEGKAIRSELIKLARSTCKSEVPPQTRLLRFGAIPSFWVEVAKALGRHRWHLPVIERKI